MGKTAATSLSENHSVDRYALFGFPVAHSWSAYIHGEFAHATQQHLDYRLIETPPADFERVVMDFFNSGGLGANVTVPHKQSAFSLVDDLTDRAQRAGAVNTLSITSTGQLRGDNTDGIGLIADLKNNLQFELMNKRVLILGAGGATRGVIGPILDEKSSQLIIANRTREKSIELAAVFNGDGSIIGCDLKQIPQGPFDLLINATSAGLNAAVPDFPAHCIGPETLAYDMTYATAPTVFAQHATACGAQRSILGWGMLVEQAAEAFRVWRGIRPQTATVLQRLQSGAAKKPPQ